jgi:hypothetical protein
MAYDLLLILILVICRVLATECQTDALPAYFAHKSDPVDSAWYTMAMTTASVNGADVLSAIYVGGGTK